MGVNILFVVVYSNEANNPKRFKARRYYLPKGIINNYNAIINGNNFYEQPIDSNTKLKLTISQGKEYTTGCLLDYEFIKNHYKLIAVNLSRQKELDTDPKAIEQIEFIVQLKNNDDQHADGPQCKFVLTILEQIKQKRLKFFQGSVTVL